MIAYELREAYAGTVEQPDPDGGPPIEVPYFTGGVITAGERDIDTREALDSEHGGAGLILVADDDMAAIVALDAYPPLKRTTVPDSVPAEHVSRYEALKVPELRADPRLADVLGVAEARKPELVTALEELDRRQAEGDTAAPIVSPTSIAELVELAAARTTTKEA